MSNPFGVPPPPPTQVFEPRPAAPLRVEPSAPVWIPEPDVGRRRAAVVCAFIAVALLVFANLAAWLSVGDIGNAQSDALASRTFTTVTTELQPELVKTLVPLVTVPGVTASEGTTAARNDPQALLDIGTSVSAALTSAQSKAAWQEAVRTGLTEHRGLLDGSAVTDEATYSFSSAPVVAAATASLKQRGYVVTTRNVGAPSFTATTSSTAGIGSALGTTGHLWWLLGLGAIALGAASIALAPRRLRMATILAVDAAAMLVVCLLLAVIVRAAAGNEELTDAGQVVVKKAAATLTHGLVVQTVVLMVLAGASAVVLGTLARRRRLHPRPGAGAPGGSEVGASAA